MPMLVGNTFSTTRDKTVFGTLPTTPLMTANWAPQNCLHTGRVVFLHYGRVALRSFTIILVLMMQKV